MSDCVSVLVDCADDRDCTNRWCPYAHTDGRATVCMYNAYCKNRATCPYLHTENPDKVDPLAKKHDDKPDVNYDEVVEMHIIPCATQTGGREELVHEFYNSYPDLHGRITCGDFLQHVNMFMSLPHASS